MLEDVSTSNSAMAKRRSRTVSDMSQQQRQHKRDVDRKAQRALRDRTKIRTRLLQEELASLRVSISEQSAAITRRISSLRQENKQLKDTLERIGHLALSKEIPVQAHVGLSAFSTYEIDSESGDCITGKPGLFLNGPNSIASA